MRSAFVNLNAKGMIFYNTIIMQQSGAIPNMMLGIFFIIIWILIITLTEYYNIQTSRELLQLPKYKYEIGVLGTKKNIITDVMIDMINIKPYLEKNMYIYILKITNETYYEMRVKGMRTKTTEEEYNYINDPTGNIYFNEGGILQDNKNLLSSLKYLAKQHFIEKKEIYNDDIIYIYYIYAIPNNIKVYKIDNIDDDMYNFEIFNGEKLNETITNRKLQLNNYIKMIGRILSIILLLIGLILVMKPLKNLQPDGFSYIIQILIRLANSMLIFGAILITLIIHFIIYMIVNLINI